MTLSACITLAAALVLGAGETRPLDDCVPQDAMAAYFGRPSAEMMEAPPGGTVDQLAASIIVLKQMGVIPRNAVVLADIVGTLPMLSRRPHALALLDVTSKEIAPDVYRLNSLQSGLIIDSQGLENVIDRRIRDLLTTYTSQQTNDIEVRRLDGEKYYRLLDRRLPAWSIIEWGQIGPHFLVCVGEGAFKRFADTLRRKAPSLAHDPWYAQAHKRTHGSTSGIEVFVDFDRVRGRIGEVTRGRPEEVLRALQLERLQRFVWTVGFEGRALHSEVVGRDQEGRDLYKMLSGDQVIAPEVARVIPPDAKAYAAFRLPLPETVRNAREAYLQSQSEAKSDRLRQAWRMVEREFKFDIEREVIDHLGDHVVFHNYPPHPLGVPILCTVWIRYDGDRDRMAASIDRVLGAWQHFFNDRTDTRPSGLRPQIVRDESGIWFLQMGLIGPAIGVADEWIVVSFSSQAVRENLEYLRQVSASGPAGAGGE